MNDGGPFFPQELTFHDEVDVLIEDPKAICFGELVKQTKIRKEQVSGISIRDWFAGMALNGMLNNGFQPNCARENFTNTADFNYVRAAYRLADQMINVRAEAKL